MTKKAYHRLLLPDGSAVPLPVCEFDEQGHLLAWHPLQGEEAGVEWVGGDFRMCVPKQASYSVRTERIVPLADEALQTAMEELPLWRREQCLRYKPKISRIQCWQSYRLLCRMLQEGWGISEPPRFITGEHGKPFLADYPGIHFNLSHCREAVACVVGDHPVGIDIETRRPYKDAVARYTMNEEELLLIQQAADPAEAFVRLWTQKEAVVKLTGEGLAGGDVKRVLCNLGDIRIETHTEECFVYSVASFIS